MPVVTLDEADLFACVLGLQDKVLDRRRVPAKLTTGAAMLPDLIQDKPLYGAAYRVNGDKRGGVAACRSVCASGQGDLRGFVCGQRLLLFTG